MIGQNIPDVVLKTRVHDESIGGDNPFKWEDVSTGEFFKNKKVVVFSLPGAFTPTCSTFQLPTFEKMFDEFKAEGVDEIVCMSVNDAFVMFQWGKQQGVKNVKLLPDGSGNFTRRMGMLINKDHLGFGMRSWRYGMVVDNGKITHWFEEPGINDDGSDADPYGETSPENILKAIKG